MLSLWDRAQFEAELGALPSRATAWSPVTLSHNVPPRPRCATCSSWPRRRARPVGAGRARVGRVHRLLRRPRRLPLGGRLEPRPDRRAGGARHRRRRPSVRGGQARRTERLVLRGWRDGDRDAFAAMNADPRGDALLPRMLTREQSDAMLDRIERATSTARAGGCGRSSGSTPARWLGFTGLAVPPLRPAVQAVRGGGLAARRARPGATGIATEAAREALRVGFDELGLAEVVSFTHGGQHAAPGR